MRIISAILFYEFKMQIRSLVFLLTTIVLLLFWYSEVFSGHQSQIVYSTATQPFIMTQPGGISVDFTAEAQAALKVANFSAYAGWLFADRVGLMSALFIGLLASFVFERDRTYDLLDVVNSRPVRTWQYVLGKYLGVVLSWALPLMVITIIEIGSVHWMCYKASLPFAFQDFTTPVFSWVGISLLYETAVIIFLSLILKSGIGTLLIHFFYWVYCVFHMSMFQTESILLFLTYWFFRLDTGLSPRTANLVTGRLLESSLNRSLYAVLTVALLDLAGRVYQVLRERGMWTLISGKSKKDLPMDSQRWPRFQ